MSEFDVVGIGLNATDTLLLVPRFPAYAGKEPFTGEMLSPGGQVASAMVTCARLGLRVKYIGTVGDDDRGDIQMRSLRESGIDNSTGERTVLWRRPDCLKLDPSEVREEMITSARMLHIDGHDTAAVSHAARIARAHGIPVTVDVDTLYHGFDGVLPFVDYLVTSSEFPARWTNESDPFAALERIQNEYGMKVAAMTLGAHGALARCGGRFHYSPAFVVNCVDTTGAGDVFHGAFCYAVLKGMSIEQTLDFCNAMAALNCTALGARGGIRGLPEATALMEKAERRAQSDFESRARAGRS